MYLLYQFLQANVVAMIAALEKKEPIFQSILLELNRFMSNPDGPFKWVNHNQEDRVKKLAGLMAKHIVGEFGYESERKVRLSYEGIDGIPIFIKCARYHRNLSTGMEQN